MNRNLSIIICTYNPDENIFSRCLDAIKKASVDYRPHEILIVDNNSSNKLSEQEYCKIFCNDCGARLINENKSLPNLIIIDKSLYSERDSVEMVHLKSYYQ